MNKNDVEDRFLATCLARQRDRCEHGGKDSPVRCHQCTVETAVDLLAAPSAALPLEPPQRIRDMLVGIDIENDDDVRSFWTALRRELSAAPSSASTLSEPQPSPLPPDAEEAIRELAKVDRALTDLGVWPAWIEHGDQDGKLRRSNLTREGTILLHLQRAPESHERSNEDAEIGAWVRRCIQFLPGEPGEAGLFKLEIRRLAETMPEMMDTILGDARMVARTPVSATRSSEGDPYDAGSAPGFKP